MEHGIPARDPYVVMIDFAEYLRREDKGKDDRLEDGGDLKIHLVLQKCREQEKEEDQDTGGDAFIIACNKAADSRQDDHYPQQDIKGVGRLVFTVTVDKRFYVIAELFHMQHLSSDFGCGLRLQYHISGAMNFITAPSAL